MVIMVPNLSGTSARVETIKVFSAISLHDLLRAIDDGFRS